MLKLSKVTGASLQIGDYIETNATVLPDGRRLLPCDGKALDEVEYPLLAAMLPTVPKFEQLNVGGAAGLGMCFTADFNTFYRAHDNTKDFYQIARTDFIENPGGTLVHSYGTVALDAACSDNGQYVFLLSRNNTVGFGISRSANSAVSFTNVNISLPVQSGMEFGRLECSPDGQFVKACLVGDDDIVRIYESSNYGVSFTEMLGISGSLTVSNTSLDNNDAAVYISSDLNTIVFTEISSSVGTSKKVYVSVNGAAFVDVSGNVSLGDDNDGMVGYTSVSKDGSVILVSPHNDATTLRRAWRGHEYAYSTDNGATFTNVFIDYEKVLPLESDGTQSALLHYHIMPDNSTVLMSHNLIQGTLVSLWELTTGRLLSKEIIGFNSDALISPPSNYIRFGIDADNIYLTNASEYNVWKFSRNNKLLLSPNQTVNSNIKIVADAPAA